MIFDSFVMLVTEHNIAIRWMDKALQHFKIECVRLTIARSFESDLLNELADKCSVYAGSILKLVKVNV